MIQLGDSHNRGKFVFEAGDVISKPRTVFWEYLFLSQSSPLRQFLNAMFLKKSLNSPFDLAPDLDVQFSDPHLGSVQKVQISGKIPVLQNEDFRKIGSLLALCFWFGLGDLHKDNLAIGTNGYGNLICFPLDIECIFDNLTHVKQTLLVPSERTPPHLCGLGQIWDRLAIGVYEDRVALIFSFMDCIKLLNENVASILKLVIDNPVLSNHPIRVVPRETRFYRDQILAGSFGSLLLSEKLQMARGDIPYFFRFSHDTEILYWNGEDKTSAGFMTNDFDLPNFLVIGAEPESSFLKKKSAIISVRYLAQELNVESELRGLSHVIIQSGKKRISVKEESNSIRYF